MTDAVAEGRAAWDRIRGRERATWDDWLCVGHALVVGRAKAMQEARSNKPLGTKYNKIMRRWLDDNGLNDINNQERYRVFLIIDNIDSVSQWRDGLDPAKRRRLNHPNAIWTHWRLATVKSPEPRRDHVMSGKARRVMPIFWSGDLIRKVALALREARSNDCFVLARRGLESLTRDDLLALLDPPPVRPPATQGEPAQASLA